VAEDEDTPNAMLYPRDPSLDPQLVWKGKDEQDRADLAVPVVPIYIQEKIHPHAIINALPRTEPASDEPPNLFADFNGGPVDFDQKIDFYHHEQNWTNRLILCDSLLVMTSLAEKEGLKGKVQTIYVDPPYGITFGSNWQVSTRKRDVKDGRAEDATRQPEQVRAFCDTWKLGIHSYLAYLRDRLVVARDLLTETGSIFVQIGDENVHLVRCVLDEVFGANNFQAQINFKSMGALGQSGLAKTYDYLLWYAKNTESVKFRPLFRDQHFVGDPEYRFIDDDTTTVGYRTMGHGEPLPEANNGLFRRSTLTSSGYTESCTFEFAFQGQKFRPFSNKSWRTNAEGMARLKMADRIFVLGGNPYFKRYATDYSLLPVENSWTDAPPAYARIYVVQTAEKFTERCILMTTDPGDLVLDPTCGSGTTAYVAEQWGRRWITCDTSRVALALARTRLMAAKYPYYLLADSPEGIKKEAELTGKTPPDYKTENDIKKGFVYKRVPHVTLKSIANNPDIREGMTREQIDAAIARHADAESLYDQPHEDNKRVRVCGPFSVESLSPHRVLSTTDEHLDGTVTEQEARKEQDFATMILDNLKKAGVQNTHKAERLTFDRLDPYAGTWLHAVCEYTDADGKTRRVAVSLGPEHGTVGPEQVKEAAKAWASNSWSSAASPSTRTSPRRPSATAG
jgi:adenine-specific DNA-methyltransferase